MIITASVVTYKTNHDELKKCIDSMREGGIAPIYVSDNSPNDELRAFCSRLEGVEYIFNNANLGYGPGHNVAIRTSREIGAKYHLVINSDVYFDGAIIPRITEYMERNGDVAQLQPMLRYPDGRLQLTTRLLPTPFDLIFRRFLPKRMGERMNYRYTLEFWDHKTPANIPYHQGSFMFFRLSAFDKVGLFDERYFMYPEDIDITRRMHKCYRTMYWPEVSVVHAHRAASYKSRKMLKIHMVNMIKYFNKWGWLIDKERAAWNRQVLKELGYKG